MSSTLTKIQWAWENFMNFIFRVATLEVWMGCLCSKGELVAILPCGWSTLGHQAPQRREVSVKGTNKNLYYLCIYDMYAYVIQGPCIQLNYIYIYTLCIDRTCCGFRALAKFPYLHYSTWSPRLVCFEILVDQLSLVIGILWNYDKRPQVG